MTSPPSSCLFEVKSLLPPELLQLFRDLNSDNLRIRRPSRFIFFCGGAIGDQPKAAGSLRHYLLNDRRISGRLKAKVILAEKANQLYRDTSYEDLITFEEDIARISALIFLIAESAGSLAELGAFAAIDTIRSNLAVIMQTDHEGHESFVRYGPIQKIKNEDNNRIGVYPWTTNKNGKIVKSSIKSHVVRITKFINELLKKIPDEELYKNKKDMQPFFIILWILYLSQAIAITDVLRYASQIIGISQKDLRNKLFCLKLAGWVSSYTYEHKTYWFTTFIADPISKYSFIPNVVRDPARRKADVTAAIQRDLRVPRHVRAHVATLKGAAA